MNAIIPFRRPRVRATGHQMATSVKIRNFRCFQSEDLSDCRRINVVVGDNGSGKTAIMEAIFLAAGTSPELALRLRQWRGFDGGITGTPRTIERALWGDLFHNHNFKRDISLALGGTRGHARELTISYQERNITIPLSKKSVELNWSPVNFSYKGPNGRLIASINPSIMADGKLSIPTAPQSYVESALFAANHTYSSAETAQRFSEISQKSDQNEVIEHFCRMFPAVEDLSIEINVGNAMVFAKKRGSQDRIPLTSLSGGMNKLASILFAIPYNRGGILLIDELENGFYYKRLPEIWRSLLYFADLYDVQIFASTHSIECLDAAADIAESEPDKFSVIHTGKGNLRQFGGEDFINAMQAHIEIR